MAATGMQATQQLPLDLVMSDDEDCVLINDMSDHEDCVITKVTREDNPEDGVLLTNPGSCDDASAIQTFITPDGSFTRAPAMGAGNPICSSTAGASDVEGLFLRPLSPFFAAINNHTVKSRAKKPATNAFKCKHGKCKDSCKQCPGKYFCTHMSREMSSGMGRRKRDCKMCGSAAYCKHGKMRKICKESECLPNASMLCEHKERKDSCKICAACNHGLIKKKCITCSPHLFCDHGRNKYACKLHPNPCSHGVRWYKKCFQCPA